MPPKRITVTCAKCKRSFPRSHYGQHPTSPKYLDQLCQSCRAYRQRRAIPNPDDPSGKSVLIPLSKGQFAIVDEDMGEYLSQWQWYAAKTPQGYYPTRHQYTGNGKEKFPVFMHRVLCPPPEGLQTDHKDGNRLNNRRANLRHATTQQNQMNRGLPVSNTSGYKGVTWHKKSKKWQAAITRNRKTYYLGKFQAAEEAARAYDAMARRVDGPEFARLNFPDNDLDDVA